MEGALDDSVLGRRRTRMNSCAKAENSLLKRRHHPKLTPSVAVAIVCALARIGRPCGAIGPRQAAASVSTRYETQAMQSQY
jgi:hypothetical protein